MRNKQCHFSRTDPFRRSERNAEGRMQNAELTRRGRVLRALEKRFSGLIVHVAADRNVRLPVPGFNVREFRGDLTLKRFRSDIHFPLSPEHHLTPTLSPTSWRRGRRPRGLREIPRFNVRKLSVGRFWEWFGCYAWRKLFSTAASPGKICRGRRPEP